MKNKTQFQGNGKWFNECWHIEGLTVNNADNVTINFEDNLMQEVFLNGKLAWNNGDRLRANN